MDCLFCKIVQRDIPAKIVFENEHILAFRDIHPQCPDHILIIPKYHIPSLSHTIETDEKLLGELMLTARNIAEELGHFSKGYRIVLNTGDHGGQTVHHIHLHLLAGKPMGWPPG
jgi:histidine triad (HIT) family protein